jgi:hypothetical protein
MGSGSKGSARVRSSRSNAHITSAAALAIAAMDGRAQARCHAKLWYASQTACGWGMHMAVGWKKECRTKPSDTGRKAPAGGWLLLTMPRRAEAGHTTIQGGPHGRSLLALQIRSGGGQPTCQQGC